MKGFYQRFTSKRKLFGNYTIKIDDNKDLEDFPKQYFNKVIKKIKFENHEGKEIYNTYIGNNDGQEETIPVRLSGEKLEISYYLTSGFGNVASYTYFGVYNQDGLLLSPDDFEFESGVLDEKVHDIMDVIVESFNEPVPNS
ncbi:MAG: hypothetical protein ABIA04_06510 [Pseudomonadota bacterium]